MQARWEVSYFCGEATGYSIREEIMDSILWKIKAGRMSYEEYYIVAPTFDKACDEAVSQLAHDNGEKWQADREDIQAIDRLRSVRVVS